MTALVFYEYAITFDLEVQQIWKGNISGVTILFILTRYITLLHCTLVIMSLSSLHSLDVSALHRPGLQNSCLISYLPDVLCCNMVASFHIVNTHSRNVWCVLNISPSYWRLPDTTVPVRRSSAIAAVRVFALWNRDWRLFAVIMVAGLFPAITNLVGTSTDLRSPCFMKLIRMPWRG